MNIGFGDHKAISQGLWILHLWVLNTYFIGKMCFKMEGTQSFCMQNCLFLKNKGTFIHRY